MAEDILPIYTFLPWLRKGISNQINEVENKGLTIGGSVLRATVDVNLEIKGDGSLEHTEPQTINLVGPGDIVGINNQAIVRTEPADWITNFEPNYLASIEFYDEDFAWRYSPAVANADNQLRPWVFLVVLKEDEFTTEDPSQGILPSIKIEDGPGAAFLPKHDELGTWAHIHVNGDLDSADTGDLGDAIERFTDLIKANPDLAVSRIICPRKLEANTNYHAFLVPTYEVGRLAGLGIATEDFESYEVQLPSWGDSADIHLLEEKRWPVYFNWYFKTGAAGDFEYLVRQLQPQALDNRIGRRPMDIQNPGYGMTYQVELSGGDPISDDLIKTTLELEGALTVPGTVSESYPFPDAENDVGYDPVDDTNLRTQIQDLVNLGEDLKAATNLATSGSYYGSVLIGGHSVEDDPIVAPPLYGRWHALKDHVEDDNSDATGLTASWIHELNLDPRQRVVAAMGTSVVKSKQDVLMDQAWEQLGDVIEANKKLYWAQLSRETSRKLFDKHMLSQPNEKLWAMTGKMKRKLLNEEVDAKSYYADAKGSQLPLASEDRSMRRIMRPAGPVMSRVDPEQKINKSIDNLVVKLDESVIAAADLKVAPVQAQKTNLTPMDSAVTNSISVDTSGFFFTINGIGDDTLSTAPNNAQAVEMKVAIEEYQDYFTTSNWADEAVKPLFDMSKADEIKTKINPALTLPGRVYNTIVFDAAYTPPADRIVPVLAYPKFRQPMYESIRDLSTDLLIPNLNLVPNNVISLLKTNQKFIESFMVGVNHEMGRELLWREYPTDQRGSYFRQFWNVADNVNTSAMSEADREEALYDIPEVHGWLSNSKLGDHNHRGDGENLVLLIRGDLLKKYPNAVIYAVQAEWKRDEITDEPLYNEARLPKADGELYPIFSGKINPDITFLGFDITEEEARGDEPEVCAEESPEEECNPGYFFVIKERPGETRFGLDLPPPVPEDFDSWNDLHWGRITSAERIELGALAAAPTDEDISGTTISWGTQMNAAEMAMVLYQNPVMVCVHAREMLNNI